MVSAMLSKPQTLAGQGGHISQQAQPLACHTGTAVDHKPLQLGAGAHGQAAQCRVAQARGTHVQRPEIRQCEPQQRAVIQLPARGQAQLLQHAG